MVQLECNGKTKGVIMFEVYACEYVFYEDRNEFLVGEDELRSDCKLVSSFLIGEYPSFMGAWEAALASGFEGVIEKEGQHICCF